MGSFLWAQPIMLKKNTLSSGSSACAVPTESHPFAALADYCFLAILNPFLTLSNPM